MRIGVLGSGDVGRTLAQGLAARGHAVVLGSRRPDAPDLRAWAEAADAGLGTATFGEAADHGEILFLAVRGTAVDAVLDLTGAARTAGKTVVDVTNPLAFSEEGPPSLLLGLTDSLGERVQRRFPEARVVKCFNTVPHTQMVDPDLPGGPPTLMLCGDDADAKARVRGLAEELGWRDVVDIGGIEEARWLEAFVPLWVRVALVEGTWDFCFRVLRPAGQRP